MSLTNNSGVAIRAFDDAQAGNINVQTTDFVELREGSALATQNRSTQPNGDITIDTRRLTVRDGSLVSTSTDSNSSSGRSGTLKVNAPDLVEVTGTSNGSIAIPLSGDSGTSSNGIIPSVLASASTGIEDAGTVEITTDRLILRDGGVISTATTDRGQGGNVNINANSVLISGTSDNQLISSGIVLDTLGAGNAGNLKLSANQLTIENGGAISASVFQLQNNPSSGGRGGNIEIYASDVWLRGTSRDGQNASIISARSFSPEPAGNISGNMNISALFVLAVPRENSDIAANAFTGNGGRVTINATGIFGLTFRPLRTPLSDITASSTFGAPGVVGLNTSNIDPSRGLQGLPTDPGDAEIAEGCAALGRGSQVEFVNIGRGGMPPSPDDWLSSDNITADWIDFPELNAIAQRDATSPNISFAQPIL
jgi:large exoprotein involved in heme utilization and adhesion